MFFHTAVMLPCWKSQGTCTGRLIEENKCLQPLWVDFLCVLIGIPENSYDHEKVILECNLPYIIITFFF